MAESTTITARGRYLDASAAVKLVLAEDGSKALREYVDSGGPFYLVSHCLVEALSVLKVNFMYRKRLSEEEYFRAAHLLFARMRNGGPIHVENVELEAIDVHSETEDLARRHKLDFSDALQLYVLRKGKWGHAVGPSKSLLITADDRLAKAAQIEGYEVWNCLKSPAPSR
jgi:predicted nucleic acid-binding protein